MSPPLKRLNFERGDGVAALLYKRSKQTVVLVKQFRYPSYAAGQGWLLEVVAGMLKRGEDAEVVMRNEITEETGYQVGQLTPVGSFFLSPGGSSERIHLYFTEVVDEDRFNHSGGLEVEGEDIEVVELPVSHVLEMIDDGAFADAKTLVALLWFRSEVLLNVHH